MSKSKRTVKKLLSTGNLSPQHSLNERYILICLPFDTIPFKIAQRVFFPLIDEHGIKVKAIIHQAFFPIIKNIDTNCFIPVLNSDIGRSLIPSENLAKEIFQYNYIAAADLNIDFNLTTAYCVHNSNAKLRIGFKSDYSDLCFNTQIDKKENDSIESGYIQIKSLITSLYRQTSENNT